MQQSLGEILHNVASDHMLTMDFKALGLWDDTKSSV